MVIMVALLLFLIWYYKRANKQIKDFVPVQGRIVKSEYDWGRRKRPGGSYRTTVSYYYNGRTYERELQYNTKKQHESELLDCLVNPDDPSIVYPANAQQVNNTMIMVGWLMIALFIAGTCVSYARLLFL
jgi:hypothetical protein